MSMLAGISAGETIWCGLAAFLTTTKLSDTPITLFGKTRTCGVLFGYKNGFARRLFLYMIVSLINLLLSIMFYTTDIIPMSIWVVAVCPLIVDNVISRKWFVDLEGSVITYYLTKVINYLIKHGLDIHSQIQNNEIRSLISQYYHGETDLSLSSYTSPLSVAKFIYKSIKSINTDDTERIIKAIKNKRKIDPVLLWSIYRVWRKKQNLTAMIRSWDRHIGYHTLEYTAVYAALWFLNIYAAVATLFALNAISRHRNAAVVHKYNVILSLVAILIYSAQIHSTGASNIIVDNLVCIMLSSGCLLTHLVTHFKPTTTTIRIVTVVKTSWLWPVIALATGNRFAVAVLIPKFYSETSKTSWYAIAAIMCGYFSNFAPIHIALLYASYIIYTVNNDAAVLLRATKVIAEYTPTQFNVTVRDSGKKITSIIDNYI
jgi:hypothetical protein